MNTSSFIIICTESQNRKPKKRLGVDHNGRVIKINSAIPNSENCAKCLSEDSPSLNQDIDLGDNSLLNSNIVDLLKNNDSIGHVTILKLSKNLKSIETESGLKGNKFDISKLLSVSEENLDELKQLVNHWKQKLDAQAERQQDESINTSKDNGSANASEYCPFFQRFRKIVIDNLCDSSFGNSKLAKKMNISESQLFRKVKAETGKSTAIYIRSIRLEKAKEYLQNFELTISEVAYESGFNCPSYFSRTFSNEFGFSPSRYRVKQ